MPEDRSIEDSVYGGGPRPRRDPQPQEPQDAVQEPLEDVEVPEPQDDASGPQADAQGSPEGSVKSFPERYREKFTGLLFLGSLEDDFEWMGHRFVVRTINTRDTIRVSTLTKPYLGTRAEGQAWQAARVALATVSVDGQPLYSPLSAGEDEGSIARAKMEIVMDWFPATLHKVHERASALEIEARAVLEAMGKATG